MRLAALLLAFSLCALAQPNLLEQAEQAFGSGDLDRAAALARQAAQRDPNSPQAHMIIGIVAAQKQRWDIATQSFQTVIRLVPADPNGYFYLGQAKLYQKQWIAAANLFQQALQKGFPDKSRVLIELAYAENEAGRPQKALARLAEAGQPDPPMLAQYHAVTAFAAGKLGRQQDAIDAIRRAREADPDNSQYHEFLIQNLIATDQTPAALREAIRAQSKFPDSGDVQFLFALASYYVVESPLSSLALRNLREAEPTSPRVLLAEGLLYRKQGKNAEATQAFKKAADRGVPDSHVLLAILYKENGEAEAAEKEFREAERINPNNGQALLELGKLSLTRGDFTDAIRRLEKAVGLMPDNSSGHYQLGLAYARAGRKEDSTKQIAISRELDSKHAELQK